MDTTVDIPSVMRQVYSWMFVGLLITAGVAGFIGSQQNLAYALIRNPVIAIVLFFAQIGVVWYLSARIMRIEPGTAIALFLVYSALTGVTLSVIFLAYSLGTVASAFIATSATFGVVSLFAYTTKMDLSRMGNILFVALIGLIIASIVNIFLASSALMWIINYAGVLIFVGLTAYDTQKIKEMAARVEMMQTGTVQMGNATMGLQGTESSAMVQRIAIMGALKLYLDFINLFIFILRIMGAGNRR
jgi:FtsH-binding integral membrane protein